MIMQVHACVSINSLFPQQQQQQQQQQPKKKTLSNIWVF